MNKVGRPRNEESVLRKSFILNKTVVKRLKKLHNILGMNYARLFNELIDFYITEKDINLNNKEYKEKKCYVYIIKLTHKETNESMYKVGHSINPNKRIGNLPGGYNKEIIQLIEKDSIDEAVQLEESIKKRVQNSIQVPISFPGDTECFKL
jgi:uncharacterized membrane-anchored protein YitT (DUF2179 family)